MFNLLSGLKNNLGFIADFFTNEEIERLRIFILWSVGAATPSLFIAWTIQIWQLHVPGLEVGANSLIPMLIGAYVLILEGVYTTFDGIIDALDVYELKVEIPNPVKLDNG